MSASTSNLPPLPQSPTPAPPAWKREASERLRAHRNGRSRLVAEQPALPGMEDAFPSPAGRPGQIAARVAQRYARIPSWRDAMAAEAAAQAAAPQPKPAAPRRAKPAAAPQPAPAADLHSPRVQAENRPAEPLPAPAATQPWQPELIRYSVSADSLPAPRFTPAQAHAQPAVSLDDAEFLDSLEASIVEPTRLLPARVLEFPRELIAPRKARPRLAEGPLRDASPGDNRTAPAAAIASGPASADGPLRLAATARSEPSTMAPPPATPRAAGLQARESMTQWQSIHLDSEEPVREPQTAPRTSLVGAVSLHVASLGDRLMAAFVDVALTLAAFLVFVLVFAACTTHPPAGRAALAGAGIALLAMGVLYQIVFFSLSAATPGMRYARIALCTFDDENPSRRAMRARIAALLLSALALGLGLLWALFDEDALGWHDRITQTYQRSYRE